MYIVISHGINIAIQNPWLLPVFAFPDYQPLLVADPWGFSCPLPRQRWALFAGMLFCLKPILKCQLEAKKQSEVSSRTVCLSPTPPCHLDPIAPGLGQGRAPEIVLEISISWGGAPYSSIHTRISTNMPTMVAVEIEIPWLFPFPSQPVWLSSWNIYTWHTKLSMPWLWVWLWERLKTWRPWIRAPSQKRQTFWKPVLGSGPTTMKANNPRMVDNHTPTHGTPRRLFLRRSCVRILVSFPVNSR